MKDFPDYFAQKGGLPVKRLWFLYYCLRIAPAPFRADFYTGNLCADPVPRSSEIVPARFPCAAGTS